MAAPAEVSIGSEPELVLSRVEGGVVRLRLTGDWRLKTGLPTAAAVEQQLQSTDGLFRLTLDASELGEWDSGLLAFLVGLQELSRVRKIELDPGNLPEGAQRLLRLATAVPERQGARRTVARPDFDADWNRMPCHLAGRRRDARVHR